MIVKNGLLALRHERDFLRRDFRVGPDGRIAEISERLVPEPGEETLDARGLQVLPGAIDPHVHFDEPGFTHREDFLHGSSEAAKGGVTTVVDMPCTSLPPVTTKAALENKLSFVSKAAVVDYAFFGGVSGHTAEESLSKHMEALAPEVVGFKTYFISGMQTFTRVTHEDFERIVRRGAELGRPILLHAEDLDFVSSAEARLRKARGAEAPRWSDYVGARSEAAETVAAATAAALARGNEAWLHVVHVGTAEAAELLSAAGASCETCAHYLAFSAEDFERLGSSLKTAPPVKARGQAERLWALLSDGTISFVTSDHAPAPEEEKNTGNLWTDYGGIPGTGTWAPYLYSEGLLGGRLSLGRYLEVTARAAAERYGLSGRKGSLETGKDADFVLADPEGTTIIEGRTLLSKGKITAFEGLRLSGRFLKTFVRGRPVYDAARADRNEHPICAAPGSGRFLRWGYR
jgi:allantoinase